MIVIRSGRGLMSTNRTGVGRRLLLFPPWFLSREVRRQIEALLPYHYHKRFRFYFDRYGCVRCDRKGVRYGCSGLCVGCVSTVTLRLSQGDEKVEALYRASRARAVNFLKRRDTAREMLADLRGSV